MRLAMIQPISELSLLAIHYWSQDRECEEARQTESVQRSVQKQSKPFEVCVEMESKATLAIQWIDFNMKINFGQLQT